jgi:ABC-type transport system involved in cytochrome c biogenesis ATPase subunit
MTYRRILWLLDESSANMRAARHAGLERWAAAFQAQNMFLLTILGRKNRKRGVL